MLHLLPIRYLLVTVVTVVALTVLAFVYTGAVGGGDPESDLSWVLHWAGTAALVLIIALYAAWRWSGTVQSLTFPYLGGEWAGELEFRGQAGAGTRKVTLAISHTLLHIKLVLDSAESTSRTLMVQADRDPDINRDRLYYVYLNERKEGVPNSGKRYRGLAILRVDSSEGLALRGDYFTELQGSGTLSLTRHRGHPWWALWK